MFPLQDTGFLDAAFESQNAALTPLSRLLYDEVVKSILRIVEKLDLSVQKVTTGEEVRRRALPSGPARRHSRNAARDDALCSSTSVASAVILFPHTN